MILPGSNALKIIDRKKNIFKLAQGEYIAPEKLESAYHAASPLISDIFVYGDSLQSCLVAVVWIEPENLRKMGANLGIHEDDLVNSENFKQALMNEFLKIAKEKNFNSLEKIRGLVIETESWMDLDLITTSFKKKRF